MTNTNLPKHLNTDRAVDELISNISALGAAVTDKVKDSAMSAIQETVDTAKEKTREFLNNHEPRTVIRTYPKTAVVAAFAVGALLGTRRLALFKPILLGALSIGSEWFLVNKASQILNDNLDDKMLH